jgi:hypothetical protein
VALPKLFEPTIFSGRTIVPASVYIRAMHPKTEIRPDRAAIKRVLDMGWAGQLKIHGHRAQFHVSANPEEEVLAYNRQGVFHRKEVPEDLASELRRLFLPTKGWSVVDAEWLKGENKVYVFDYLKKDGVILKGRTYQERYDMLPRAYISPIIETLPLYKTVEKCMEALDRDDERIEGLVFKALETPGFNDTSIIRCRKVKPH